MLRNCCWVILTLVFAVSGSAEEWRPLSPAFRAKETKFSPTVGFNLTKKGEIILRNRGGFTSVQSTQDFALSFSWRYTAGKDDGGYQDVLTVGIATDGDLNPQWSHEIVNGIAIALQAHAGEVTVHSRTDGTVIKGLGGKKGLKFERGKDYKVHISRYGALVTVKIEDVEVLQVKVPEDAPKLGKILIYNREPVAAIEQESILGDIKLMLP